MKDFKFFDTSKFTANTYAETGIISKFTQFLERKADKDWAESIALTTLATAVSPHFTVQDDTVTREFTSINLFSVVIAPSRIGHKSRGMYALTNQTLKRMGNLVPGDFTVEGLLSWLQEERTNKESETRAYCLLADECTTLFKTKNYQNGMYEFLSTMYSNHSYFKMTRKAGLESIDDTMINYLGTTTYHILQHLEETHFTQGLGNRILWLSYIQPNFVKLKGDVVGVKDLKMIIGDIMMLNKSLQEKYGKTEKQAIILTKSARDLYEVYDFYNKQEGMKMIHEDKMSLIAPYTFELPQFVMKISALKCISDNYLQEKKNPESDFILAITKEIMEYAILRVEIHYKAFLNILKEWRETSFETPAKNDRKELEKINIAVMKITKNYKYGAFSFRQLQKAVSIKRLSQTLKDDSSYIMLDLTFFEDLEPSIEANKKQWQNWKDFKKDCNMKNAKTFWVYVEEFKKDIDHITETYHFKKERFLNETDY